MSLLSTALLFFSAGAISLSPEYPVAYKMKVALDTASQELTGSEIITFINPTDRLLDTLCFHLYPNAFRDTSSAFAHESDEIKRDILSGNTSSLTVSDVMIDGERIDSSALAERGTLLYLLLPASLPPGKQLEIALSFNLKLPRARMRFGYNSRGNYLLSHWHPILCGYQKGKLIDYEYHANSEFFSNFSSYDVRLEIPADFEIGSTGNLELIEKDSSWAIWQATADTVIDFAFACGSGFEVTESDTLGIKIRYLIESRHTSRRERADWITKYSLAYNSELLFRYPYRVFTVVDFNAGADGMELPGMIAVTFPGGEYGPMGQALLNLTIAHEVAHEWFYAVVATNEGEEPWLDEGFSTYVTSRLLAAGGDSLDEISILGYKIPLEISNRLITLMMKAEYPIDLESWQYPDMFTYAGAVYYRAAAVLSTLEHLLGKEAFDRALANYARTYRFGHPSKAEFIESVSDYTGVDLGRFYEQFIEGTARVDYEIRSLKYNSLPKTDSSQTHEVKIVLAHELGGILPQRLSIALENGSVIDTVWDGVSRVQEFSFITSSRPEFAEIIPYELDEDLANNTLYMKSLGSHLMSFEWDIISLIEMFLVFFQ